jgi:serine/threonine-protein kinase
MVSEGLPAEAGDLPVGVAAVSRLADYHLEERIGAGGMAVVFRARDERLQRRVALKVLAPALAGDEAFRQRFIRESRAAAAVDDPHIIPVFEAGEAEGVLFLAMRYVPGGDVRTLVRRAGPLSPAQALAIISPVASALDAAHSAGLVHRDVKLANILLDARPGRPDHVYLSDFGLSKMVMSSLAPTQAGQFLGTPGYSAPEQLEGKQVDGRADQYSLACATFELLCGQTPFPRDQFAAVIWAHLKEPPPTLTSRRADLPPDVDSVLAKALAKDPADRYGSCRAFAEALREALSLASYNAGPGASPQADDSSAKGNDSEDSHAEQPNLLAPAEAAEIIDSGGTREAAAPNTVPETPVSRQEEQHEARGIQSGHPSLLTTPAPVSSRSSPDTATISEPFLRSGGSHRAQPTRRPRRRWPIVTTSLVVLLAVVVGGGYIAWRWSQDQYYVGADSKGEVVIFRGVNQHIAGISLSRPYHQTGIKLAQVPSPYQQTLKATDAVSSLSGARAIVANVQNAVSACRQAYLDRQAWVAKDRLYQAYRAAVVVAGKQHKRPPAAVANPGPEPPLAGSGCPPPTVFGVAAADLVLSAATS